VALSELPVEMTSEWQLCSLVPDGPSDVITATAPGGSFTISFLTEGLSRLKAGLRRAGLSPDYFPWPPKDDPGRSPYRGLEALDVSDAAVFFGRDAEILHGLDRLRGMRASDDETLFVILGPSGAGKSSFLRAGLLSRLGRDDRHFFPLDAIRPEGGSLFGERGLAYAIAKANATLSLAPTSPGEIKTALASGVEALSALLLNIQNAARRRIVGLPDEASPPTVVISVDQAEQLFAASRSEENHAFLSVIGQALQASVQTRGEQARARAIVMLTIRSDRFEPLQTAPELAGIKSVVFDVLRPMPSGQFKEVIVGPAGRDKTRRPVTFEPDLVNALLVDGAKGADTLPLLSLTLQRLYRDYASGGILKLEHYKLMGGVSEVISREVESVLSINPQQRASELETLRAAFIPSLVTIGPDPDQPMSRIAHIAELPPSSAPLIQALVEKRLLLSDVRDRAPTVQVAHESLLRHWNALQDWLREDGDSLKELERLEQASVAWKRTGMKIAWLIGGERLAAAEALASRPGYQGRLESIRQFLRASRRQETKQRASRGILVAIVVGGLALTTWLTLRPRPVERTALRSTQAVVDDADLGRLIVSRGFFEGTRNRGGRGFANAFSAASWQGAPVVMDREALLTWQRDGSSQAMTESEALEYVRFLNTTLYAGYADWRLPTLDEALTLVEPKAQEGGLYIDQGFSRQQPYIWTVDLNSAGEHWSVNFRDATAAAGVVNLDNFGGFFARAVRSGTDRFSQVDLTPIANLAWQHIINPPASGPFRGIPFRILHGDKAVFATPTHDSQFNEPQRVNEASLDVHISDAVSAHVLVVAGWLVSAFKGVKVGEVDFIFEKGGPVRADLIGWQTVRESWNAYQEPVQPATASAVTLSNVFFEPQQRGENVNGRAVIDMLSVSFAESCNRCTLKRILLRDTSQPVAWFDTRVNHLWSVDPGLLFMGITVKSDTSLGTSSGQK
jgi:hypothetical protein